jgi:uncharacterized membrane protein
MLGRTVTHHYVLLDDSLSMGDTAQGVSAYQLGVKSLQNLLESLGRDRGSHQVTILRYSRAARFRSASVAPLGEATSSAVPVDSVADVLARTVPRDVSALLEPLQRGVPTGLELSPAPALQMVEPLLRQARDEEAIVYLISDFRDKDWRQPQQIRAALETLRSAKATFQFIDCAASSRENLTMVSLQPDQEVLAASVPVMMRLEVRNTGPSPQRNVNVNLRIFEKGEDSDAPRPERFASGEELSLPALVIEAIPAGETVSRRFQVVFSRPGSQVVQASLGDDALVEDNSIASVLEIVEGQPLLVIDGEDSRRGAFYLNATLNPGGMTKTGWRPVTETPAFLRDTTLETLETYAAIALLNVRSLDPRAVANLEEYVRRGGGMAVFLGGALSPADYERCNREWYRQGEGFLPAPLVGTVELPVAASEAVGPDILATDHPIFGPLLGLGTTPFPLVRVSRYVRLGKPPQAGVVAEGLTAVARWRDVVQLRDGHPLMIDYGYGDGRIILVGTSLDPSWTNWPQDPSFVVGVLKTMGYLASYRSPLTASPVGSPIDWKFSSREMLPEAEVVLAKAYRQGTRPSFTAVGKPRQEPILELKLEPDPIQMNEEQLTAILSPGVTEIWNTSLQGLRQVQCFARNAPAAEGELKKIAVADLKSGLQPVEFKYRTVDSIASTAAFAGLTNRQGLLLALLVGMLLLEQFLAWSASYHLPRVSGAKTVS